MIDQLLAYQEVDKRLKNIEAELGKSEERKKTHSAQAFLKSVNDNLAALDKRAEELLRRYNSVVKTYEKLDEEIKGYDGLEVGEDIEQLNYIKKKAQSLSSEISVLAETLENITKEISSVMKEFSKLKSETKTAKKQYEEYLPKYNALKESRKEEIDAIRAELAKLEKEIPTEIMDKYKQRRKDKLFPVLNLATELGKNGVYCACGKSLPDAAYATLKSGVIVECESCHRLLYLK